MDDCFPWEDDLYEMGNNESWEDFCAEMQRGDEDDEDDDEDDENDDEDDIVDMADRLFARINDLPDEPRAEND